MTANFHPDVVAASRRDNRKPLVRDRRERVEFLLDSAELCEGLLRSWRNQLPKNPRNRFEGQRARRQLHLSGRRNNVRTLANMQDERVPISTNNGGQQ
jgi:hypothetical protein